MNATKDLHIEPCGADTYLVGRCMDKYHNWNESRLRLDDCLGDDGGRFEWGGKEFTDRAQNIRFNPDEGASHVPVLRAQLQDDQGKFLDTDVNLAERINNQDGSLLFN
ncbi:hypothetical protein N7491_010434 [Penicillium cf. griseofulvum]|uniref:Cyanovirin-N domain-containing protein n=1 Tax=Penicillium cf. griseofulvum TaxID=2972120 RepID=A0A9W9MZV6_9EURO|nr:hypothetical protein N7472_000767 [Penicillium cf. griseofulvum]KAJ5421989.1 hypothetical protein N7491_010434 [Penicillium cf. griseofulvum]KAJ5428182.1 hypothetical protein N7445_009636 [Penicillium cf. griseofulvum]